MSIGFESVHIEFPKYGERKVVVDGKELDLSQIKSLTVKVDAVGIDINVDMPRQLLPYKK